MAWGGLFISVKGVWRCLNDDKPNMSRAIFYTNRQKWGHLRRTKFFAMKFDYEKIEEQLSQLLRKHWRDYTFVVGTEPLDVKNVTKVSVLNLEQGDYMDGYNFQASGQMRIVVQLDEASLSELLYNFSCILKVEASTDSNEKEPQENITSIKNNKISVRPC